mmetsp:Transcript_109759/g.310525  ORF Transcript_109759/g.310525 Transcript_109759/m.310525 type:complete len:230 (-) Transcript_109759:388-1077(-)
MCVPEDGMDRECRPGPRHPAGGGEGRQRPQASVRAGGRPAEVVDALGRLGSGRRHARSRARRAGEAAPELRAPEQGDDAHEARGAARAVPRPVLVLGRVLRGVRGHQGKAEAGAGGAGRRPQQAEAERVQRGGGLRRAACEGLPRAAREHRQAPARRAQQRRRDRGVAGARCGAARRASEAQGQEPRAPGLPRQDGAQVRGGLRHLLEHAGGGDGAPGAAGGRRRPTGP